MDPILQERLNKWHSQIEVLEEIEGKILPLEASEKSLYAELFLAADAKTIAEKEAKAHASQAWKDFQKGLALGRTELNKQKRLLELKQKAFDAAYLTAKRDDRAIRSMHG